MSAVSSVYYFIDQNTQNPLPGGIGYTIYLAGAPQVPGNVIASGTLNPDGSAYLALLPNTWYTAIFIGTGAPNYAYNFQTGSGAQVVGPFVSATLQNSANGGLSLVSGTSQTTFKWVEASVNTGADGQGSAAVVFATPFPNGILRVFPGIDDGAAFSGYAAFARALQRTPDGFTAFVGNGPPNSTVLAEFLVLGY